MTAGGSGGTAGCCDCGSALLDVHGEVLAVARTVWVDIPKPGSAP